MKKSENTPAVDLFSIRYLLFSIGYECFLPTESIFIYIQSLER